MSHESRNSRSADFAKKMWRWVSLTLGLGAMPAAAAVYFVAGPLCFLVALVALTPLCIALSLVDNRITDGSWLLPRY